MAETLHPNLSVLTKLDIRNLDACRSLFADDFVWHYFNPRLPELEGKHRGFEGLKGFFARLGERSNGSFRNSVIDARPMGDELVVTHVCNQMELDGDAIELDAVVIWRIVGSKIAEAWDIPAVNTVRTLRES